MSLNTIVVQGTLKPDGTLELDEKPTLAPGRVHVMLQPVSIGLAARGGLAETIEEIRRHQQARGYQRRSQRKLPPMKISAGWTTTHTNNGCKKSGRRQNPRADRGILMLIYLDTCIVIYAVEGQAPFQQRAQTHIAALEAAGYRFLISDLTRGECLVHPLGRGDATLLLDYHQFFLSRSLVTKSLTPSIYDRAARIRGQYRYIGGRNYGLADSLHVAAAIEYGCERLVTNDARLDNFSEVTVEILP